MLHLPKKVPEPGFYYHYKHDPEKGIRHHAYEVMGVGSHTEENCRPEDLWMVDYRPLSEDALVWQASLKLGVQVIDHRPLEMFMETITKDGKEIHRFQKITDPKVISQLEEYKKQMYKF